MDITDLQDSSPSRIMNSLIWNSGKASQKSFDGKLILQRTQEENKGGPRMRDILEQIIDFDSIEPLVRKNTHFLSLQTF